MGERGQVQITIDIPSNEWISANDRLHWAAKAKRTRALRERGKIAAIAAGRPRFRVCAVWAYVGYPRGGKADPGNAYPSIKACIDGFTDAGLWADDNSDHLKGPYPERDPATKIRGVHRIRFVLIEQEVSF